MNEIFDEIRKERQLQDEKWGIQDHPPIVWNAIIGEEAGEVSKAALDSMFDDADLSEYRKELIQTAAVCVAALQCLDRGYADSHEDEVMRKPVESAWTPIFGRNSEHMESETGKEYEVLTDKGNIYVGLSMDWGFVPNGDDDETPIEDKDEQVVFFRETGKNLYE